MTPHQPEQRSEPEGPRSRVPRGIAKGGWASSPPWLAVKGEKQGPPQRNTGKTAIRDVSATLIREDKKKPLVTMASPQVTGPGSQCQLINPGRYP